MEGYGLYVKEIFSRIVRKYPEHTFIFVFDRPYDAEFIFAPNIIPLVVSPPARHAFAFKYWYDIKAPLALRAYHPDVWVQPYGFCSLSTKIPQVLMVYDLAFLHYPQFISWPHRLYYRLFTKKFLKKAKKIITVSGYSKEDIMRNYLVDEEKIDVVPGAAGAGFQPLSWQEKEQVKMDHAGGSEYFLFTGGIHPRKNLLNLLKAFSLFKKWQQSNMKLLVAGRLAWKYDAILKKLENYKYRSDVILLGYIPEDLLIRITGAAYALVYPSFFEGFGLPVIEAMRCEVPVIASNTSALPETGGPAALYADPADPADLAKQMLSLYKDEILRNRLIAAGKANAARFSWDDSAQKFWEFVALVAGEGQRNT